MVQILSSDVLIPFCFQAILSWWKKTVLLSNDLACKIIQPYLVLQQRSKRASRKTNGSTTHPPNRPNGQRQNSHLAFSGGSILTVNLSDPLPDFQPLFNFLCLREISAAASRMLFKWELFQRKKKLIPSPNSITPENEGVGSYDILI